MNKFTTILCGITLLPLALVTDATAVRTAHKPWLSSKKPESSIERIERRTSAQMTRRMKKHTVTSSSKKASPHKGHKIAEQAVSYKGARYRMGGDSKSKGFDCSGLIRRVYNDLNLKQLPRTSSGLYTMGTPIRLNELRPGDLVFFKNTYKRGISHVGVYAGDNRFVHAENRRRGVTLTSLADPYYQIHYAGARRLY